MKINTFALPIAFLGSVALASVAFAQAPAGSTGLCKDGTYTSVEKKRGACAGHKGVKEWFGAQAKSEAKGAKGEAKPTGAMMSPAPAGAMAAPAATPAAPRPSGSMSTASTGKGPRGMRAEAAPGGGAGKVWVNPSSHVYHCMGDEWYGKTKSGEYMSEAAAKAQGAHASRGKTCG